VPYIRDQAIVIGAHRSKEHDKIVSLFSRDHGLLKTIARRAVGPKSKFGSSLEILSYLNVQLFRKSEESEWLTLCQAALIRKSPVLEADFDTLSCGSFFCELISSVASVEQPDPDLFTLLSQGRALLEEKNDRRTLALAFLLHALETQGLQPELASCATCEKPLLNIESGCVFYPHTGTTHCLECAQDDASGVKLDEKVLKRMIGFQHASLKKCLSEKTTHSELEQIADALMRHSEFHLHHRFRSLKYLFPERNVSALLNRSSMFV